MMTVYTHILLATAAKFYVDFLFFINVGEVVGIIFKSYFILRKVRKDAET